MHKTVLVTGPASEPLTLEEAQRHLRFSGQEDFINSLIITARRSIERYLNRVLITQEWKVYYDNWCDLKIPFGNLQLVAAVDEVLDPPTPAVEKRPLVKYRNQEGVLTELDEDAFYWVVNTTDPAYVHRKYDATYPVLQYGRPDAIEITFRCGFGDSADNIPEEIRHAMKLLITDYFEHRGSIVIGQVNKIPDFISDIIHSYKLYEF